MNNTVGIFISLHIVMKSTKVQNPRCIPRIKPIMRAAYLPLIHRGAATPRSVLAATQASCIMHSLDRTRYSNNPPRRAERPVVVYVDFVGHAQSTAGGWVTKLYACALLIIDGLGHATWSSTMPVSRSRTAPL